MAPESERAMPFVRRVSPAFEGRCVVRFGRAEAEAPYRLNGDPSQLRTGPKGLRGSCTLEPALAAEAFRTSDGQLQLEDGSEYRLRVLAYTAGSDTVYFEIRRFA
jgi:hypothetical protein